MPPLKGEDTCEHVERVSAIAWSNGAYKATEALKAENARLKAEVERLTPLLGDIVSFDEYHKLLQQVERLTKAGDAMAGVLGLPINAVQEFELNQAWHKAKGVQS